VKTHCCSRLTPEGLEDARIMTWFVTGLRHEAIRLAKKHKQLQEHEPLILNDLLSQDAEDEVTEMLDTGTVPRMQKTRPSTLAVTFVN